MKKLLLLMIALAFAFSSNAYARNWNCHATISLTGSGATYTVPNWGMSGNALVDREKKCKQRIQSDWLNNKKIWNYINLSSSEQNSICKKGTGTFRVDYGFDRRPKSWDFTQTIPAPPCDCELSCKAGYDLDTNNPRCVKLLCKGGAVGIPDNRYGPHNNGLGIWGGNIYHHQPATQGNCKFK